MGRIPYGMRGLKLRWRFRPDAGGGRIPYGMRGLKLCYRTPIFGHLTSHPIRDAWIEISATEWCRVAAHVASHTGCVD